MIQFLIGADGGGTGTRVRLATADGTELGQGQAGPSGLAHGIGKAWAAIGSAIDAACAAAGIMRPANAAMALGAGLAGVHNKEWAAQFTAANPGFSALRLATDGFTTLMGAHGGAPGCIVALGTGSVGEALLADGTHIEVGGWGFPAGDEASGAWLGLRAINHVEQVLDGRVPSSDFASAVIDTLGGSRDAIQVWLGGATQTAYASLAPVVIRHAQTDATARSFLVEAGHQVALMANALDKTGRLPLALCGGLGAPLRPYLPPELERRAGTPQGDAAFGALRMIQLHLARASAAQSSPSSQSSQHNA